MQAPFSGRWKHISRTVVFLQICLLPVAAHKGSSPECQDDRTTLLQSKVTFAEDKRMSHLVNKSRTPAQKEDVVYCGWITSGRSGEDADCRHVMANPSDTWIGGCRVDECSSLTDCTAKCDACSECEAVRFSTSSSGGGGIQCHMKKTVSANSISSTVPDASWPWYVNSRSASCDSTHKCYETPTIGSYCSNRVFCAKTNGVTESECQSICNDMLHCDGIDYYPSVLGGQCYPFTVDRCDSSCTLTQSYSSSDVRHQMIVPCEGATPAPAEARCYGDTTVGHYCPNRVNCQSDVQKGITERECRSLCSSMTLCDGIDYNPSLFGGLCNPFTLPTCDSDCTLTPTPPKYADNRLTLVVSC